MAEERKWNPTDAGIGYASAGNAVQKVLDKLKSYRKRPTDQGQEKETVPGDTPGTSSELSEMLDNLIELEYPETVVKSVWRKIKKPSARTMTKIRKGEH